MTKELPKTLGVVEAGRLYFNLGRNASYQAVKSGQLPVIKIGGKVRVPVAVLEKMLDVPVPKKAETSKAS